MALSADAVRSLAIALTSQALGNEVASAINGASGASDAVVMVVTDAAASTALAGLLPGDLVLDLTTVANNVAASILVVTANTIAFTPTAHDVLVVLRPVPAATSFKF
jgi:hypothetical protein